MILLEQNHARGDGSNQAHHLDTQGLLAGGDHRRRAGTRAGASGNGRHGRSRLTRSDRGLGSRLSGLLRSARDARLRGLLRGSRDARLSRLLRRARNTRLRRLLRSARDTRLRRLLRSTRHGGLSGGLAGDSRLLRSSRDARLGRLLGSSGHSRAGGEAGRGNDTGVA